jgi:hypothetical protein
MARALILLLGGWNCHAAEVRIRVINSKSGKPKAAISLKIQFLGGPGRRADLPAPGLIEADLNDQGMAVVDIEVIPHRRFEIFSPGLCCHPAMGYDVESVLRTGIVGKNQCWHKSPRLNGIVPRPGEVTLFWDSLNFFELFKHTELWPLRRRDESQGLDYADQRYYSSISGRFLLAKP